MDGHCQKRHGHLFARGHQAVHFGQGRGRGILPGQVQEAVGLPGLGGQDHYQLVGFVELPAHIDQDLLHAIQIRDGCAAEFLDHDIHGKANSLRIGWT